MQEARASVEEGKAPCPLLNGVYVPTRQSCLDWSTKDMDLGHKSPSRGLV